MASFEGNRGPVSGLSTLIFLALVGACGDSVEDVDETVATLLPVRGEVSLAEEAAPARARAARGQALAVAAGGLARLILDDGPAVLIGPDSALEVGGPAALEVSRGKLFATVASGDSLSVEVGVARLRATDAAFSLTVHEGRAEIYVVRGEVSFTSERERGAARAGEKLSLTSEAARIEAAPLWDDWTGGLARPGPEAAAPEGIGVLSARVPDEIGEARWPLAIRRLDVRVTVTDDLAVTEVDQEFFNPASEMVEGLYEVRVPDGAVLSRFAVDRDGSLVDGYVKERAQARAQYEAQVYRGSTEDPALLEWDAPGSFRARIYPINPGETRRIVVRYAEWLGRPAPGAPRLYRYPMGAGASAPQVQEFSFLADVSHAGASRVRAGHGATVEEGSVRLRRSDFRPRTDLWLELVDAEQPDRVRAYQAEHVPPARAPGSPVLPNEADERDYWYLPVTLPEETLGTERTDGIDLVVVADVSAATDRSHLELGRSVVDALAAHLRPEDRIAVVTSDLTIRPVNGDGRLAAADPARMERLLDGLARAPAGGATDLGAALTAAAELIDPSRSGAIVYVGDGAPTVGELGAAELLERMSHLPRPARLYAVAVGADANLELLETLTRGGGFALRVEERAAAAEAALRLHAHASRPLAQQVRVELGSGIDTVFPRVAVDLVAGEVLPVIGRVRDAVPERVTVRGVVRGQTFEIEVPVETRTIEDGGDLRLRWAGERLRQLLLEGAGREEVADLGTRYGLITPFTSFYVPSRNELGPYSSLSEDVLRTTALALFTGPLMLTGCFSAGEDSAPMSSSEVTEEEASGSVAPVVTSPATPADMPARAAEQQNAPTTPPAVTATPTAEPAPQPQQMAGDEAAAVEAPPPPPEDPSAGADFGFGGLADNQGHGEGGGGSGGNANGVTGGTEATRGGGGSAGPGYFVPGQAPPEPEEPARPSPDVAERREPLARQPAARTVRETSAPGASDDFDALEADQNQDRLRAQLENVEGEADGDLGGRSAHKARGRNRGEIDIRIRIRSHRPERCSDAASLSLSARTGLWRERLQRVFDTEGYVDAYRRAQNDCELRTWRDRRAMLDLILRQAGTIQSQVQVYGVMPWPSARSYLRSAIRKRVRTPEDLRIVREAFGLSYGVDWELVEQILLRQTDDAGRIRALRALVAEHPDSFELRLRLLAMLETADREPEARRLAESMRADPLADAGVRTAIGELYIRLGDEAEARRTFSEIVEFAPEDEVARRRLGDLYRAHGWFDDAYRQYQTLETIRPDDPSVMLLRAQAAAGAGRVEEALQLEQRLAGTSAPGEAEGLARTAILWSSVRFAMLRKQARDRNNRDQMRTLLNRMRRTGVLRDAPQFRAALVWSHPDAGLQLLGSHPGLRLARPSDIAPEFGIEVFDAQSQESGAYTIEVRRPGEDHRTVIEAQLVLIWRQGEDDEQVQIIPLRFEGDRYAFAWTVTGDTVAEATPTPKPEEDE